MAEYSVKSEVGQRNKEKLEALVKEAGYDTIKQFSRDAGIDVANLYSNLDGTWKMSMGRMFKVANTLGVPVLQIVDIFYHDELAKNQSLL